MNDTVLAHHGVKGMKWGVRKADNQPVASAGGGGGGELLDEETAELLKALREGKITLESMTPEQLQKVYAYNAGADAQIKQNLKAAGGAALDYVQHLPSDGIFQFRRKDGTGFLNEPGDAERYQRHKKAEADVQAFAKRERERLAAAKKAGEDAATKYRTSPGSTHTDTKDYGLYEVTSVYKNDSKGRAQRVGSRAKNKQTGDVSYGNGMPFDIGTDRSKIDQMISEGQSRENAARKYGRKKYESQFRHSAMLDDPVYLVHHGVKGMKWGIRKSPSERASAKSIRYAKKAAKLQKKVVKLKKRELKNTKKELKAVYRGNIKGERTYKRRRVVASVKAAKKEAKAAKFTAKSQQMLKKSMQLKANEVNQQTKDAGRKQIDKVINS